VNLFKIPLVKVTGLLALALLLVAGCTETPDEPDANIAPDTFITSYNIGISPDSGSYYATTVYWRSSDPDGVALRYHYRLLDDGGTQIFPHPDSGEYITTFETSVIMSLEFPTGAEMYTFYVRTEDNNGRMDPTPAGIDIAITTVRSLDEFEPNTMAISVPPNGASTSRGVPFAIGGNDVDGIVTSFEWAVDDISNDTMWTAVTPDDISVSSSSAVIELTSSDLTFGPHVVYFRAVDNFGNVDSSPLSVAIVCDPGYEPEVSVSVSDGFNFVVPFTEPTIDSLEIEITAIMDYYFGGLDHFNIVTSVGDTLNISDYSFMMTDLSSGSYWFTVTAFDLAGNSASITTNFGVVELAAGDGVLCSARMGRRSVLG
jgi:hypothetical protein